MNTSRFIEWARDARERVISTAVYLVGAIATVQLLVDNTGLFQQEWQQFTAIGGVTLGLNIIKVIAAAGVGNRDNAAISTRTGPSLEGDDSEEGLFPDRDDCIGGVCEATAHEERYGTD